MLFFCKFWQDFENGEMYVGVLVVEFGMIGFVLLFLLLGGVKKFIEIFWY